MTPPLHTERSLPRPVLKLTPKTWRPAKPASEPVSLISPQCWQIAFLVGTAVGVVGFWNGVDATRILTMAVVYFILAAVCAIPAYWKVERDDLRWFSPAVLVSAAFAAFYIVGSIPPSLWAYDKMYVQNPGSYEYFPKAGLFAAACLLVFLIGYRAVASKGTTSRSIHTWDPARLSTCWWIYAILLVSITVGVELNLLPSAAVSFCDEFLPSGYVVLTVLAFAVRSTAKGRGLGPFPVQLALAVVIPLMFFILANHRFYSLAILVLILLLSRAGGASLKIHHYVLTIFSGLVVYLVVTLVVRPDQEDLDVPASLGYKLKRLPQALNAVLSDKDYTKVAASTRVEADVSGRMAGLEIIAGMFAAEAGGRAAYLRGKCAEIGILKMIPRAIWRSKPVFGDGTGWSEEDAVIQAFNLDERDQLTTPPVTLYGDGGWVISLGGMLLLGACFSYLFSRSVSGPNRERGRLLGLAYSFSLFMFFQRDCVGWVVHPLRNLVVVFLLVKFADALCSRRLRPGAVAKEISGRSAGL